MEDRCAAEVRTGIPGLKTALHRFANIRGRHRTVDMTKCWRGSGTEETLDLVEGNVEVGERGKMLSHRLHKR